MCLCKTQVTKSESKSAEKIMTSIEYDMTAAELEFHELEFHECVFHEYVEFHECAVFVS